MSTTMTPLGSSAFDYITNLVRDRSAIVLESSKGYLIESRLTPIARQHGLGSLDDLVAAMKKPGGQCLTREVVEAMTTNETSFFRDIHPFDALRTNILPDLIARRSRERTLNIWSNACSSGQEPYTIALLLREHFHSALNGWSVKLLGSDLSSQILQRARDGLFNQTEVNRGLPAPLLVKYFQREGMQWRLKDEVRRMVEFRELNLIENWPPLAKMDVVFLRNVLIYFAPETKKTILAKVRQVLSPDGYLFLGGAETTMNLDTSFERVQIAKAVCYRLAQPGNGPAATTAVPSTRA